MRYRVEVQLRKHGAFQRASQLDFTVVGKTQTKARRNALGVFNLQRGDTYRALTCGLGTDGALHLLVAKASEVDAMEEAQRGRIQAMAKRGGPSAENLGSEGRRRTS
jgi:hypothetical protein